MKKDEIFKQLHMVFQDVFDNEHIIITESTAAEHIAEWDSLMHITLISAVEDEFQVKFSMQEIMDMKNVGEMMALIEQKMGN